MDDGGSGPVRVSSVGFGGQLIIMMLLLWVYLLYS